MNTEDKIEKCLKSAPKPMAPDGLLNRLQEDVAAGEIKKRVTVIRRWFATLSNGKGFGTRNPEMLGLSEAEQKEFLKKQFDEIEELRKAGKFEKIYKPEHDFEIDGVKYRYYLARYTLSGGTVKTVGSSEPVKDKEENKE